MEYILLGVYSKFYLEINSFYFANSFFLVFIKFDFYFDAINFATPVITLIFAIVFLFNNPRLFTLRIKNV